MPVATRFTSVHTVVKRFLELRPAFKLIVEDKPDVFTDKVRARRCVCESTVQLVCKRPLQTVLTCFIFAG